MEGFKDLFDTIGILATILISTVTLFTTRAMQISQQQTTIMAAKRSERIDLMRKYSAGLISCGKQLLYGIAGRKTKAKLVCYAENLISLLQYAYPLDVVWVDCINSIVRTCMKKELNKKKLKRMLREAWRICDIYVGVEHERLKNESKGNINGSGKVNMEAKTFEDLYKELSVEQEKYFAKQSVK